MEITRNGIIYNLPESCYRKTIEYGDNKIVFVFSSKLYKQKFIDKLYENRTIQAQQLYNKYNMFIVTNEIYDIALYSKIEKRGYYIIINGVETWKKEKIIFGGARMTIRESLMQSEVLTQKSQEH